MSDSLAVPPSYPISSGSVSFEGHGFSEDTRGYSGQFSWWRDHTDYRYHHFLCYEEAFCVPDGSAVCDNFGNLVPVARVYS